MQSEQKKHPDAKSEFFHLTSRYFTIESRKKGVEFKPDPSDVVLSTAAKSGTTWLQQICHGLRSGGNMEFDEISLVFPCLEMAHDYGYEDLQAPQPYTPRMYKTHYWYRETPKGAGKYIVVVRRPVDVAVSYFHFMQGWFFKHGDIPMDEFIEMTYLARGAPKDLTQNSSQIHHIMSWYPYRHDNNVLWLHYEDLKQDLRGCVKLIAEFLDIGAKDEALQDLVTRQASLAFMKAHATKFDEHQLKLARNEACGQPRETGLNGCGKIRSGGTTVSEDILQESTLNKIQQKWMDVIGTQTGYETYEAFRHGINNELGRAFKEE